MPAKRKAARFRPQKENTGPSPTEDESLSREEEHSPPGPAKKARKSSTPGDVERTPPTNASSTASIIGPTLRRSNREGVRDCHLGVKAGLAPRRLEDIQAQAKSKKDKISAEHAAKEIQQAAECTSHLKNVHKVAGMLDQSAHEEKEAAASFDRYPSDSDSDSDTDMPDGAILVRELQERHSQSEGVPDDIEDDVGAWPLSDAPDAAPKNFEQQGHLQEVPGHDFVSDTTQEEHGRLRGDGPEEHEGSKNGHGRGEEMWQGEEGVLKDQGAALRGGEQRASGRLIVKASAGPENEATGVNDASKAQVRSLTFC
ncbi:hypothetical protein L226DRAFT_577007 [Lentinus tigrinus ALCF2SS1-7]|uniref:uncharacterized protein n=1 Tax=Lentinus tigrinus ALCF2SS1-7 TaxID=1328758 RepID=UPI001165E4A6|nr:hypothetical protein L226DRAFT_577007 [Lentinus tigrinus ALCF2SS1-7]